MKTHRPSLIRLAVVLLGALTLSAVACSGSSATAPQPAGSGQPSGGSGAPKVNRVVMAVNAPAMENNDPRGDRGPTNWIVRPMYEYLVGVDPSNGKYIPQLATEWSLQPDGQSFRFKLRQGVKYHFDKGEFGPDALIDTFKVEASDPNPPGISPSGNVYLLLNPLIAGIDKTGPDEVLMRLKQPDGTFMLTISEQRGVFYMLSGKHFQELGQPNWQTGPAAGTGPYQFKERAQGQFIRFERVPYQHWRSQPDFPEFEFRYMKEPSTRMASLLAGEVQVADLPQDLKVQAEKQGFKLLQGKVPGFRAFAKFYCCHNKDKKNPDSGWIHPESPLADARVRKALTKAIDMAQINKVFFGGKGEVMQNAHFHPTRAGWDPSWVTRYQDEYGYDPEAARRLLAEAGYTSGKPMETNILLPSDATGYSGADDIMEAVGNMWRAAGVNVTLVQIDPARQNQLTAAKELYNHTILGGTGSDIWTGVTTYGSAVGTGIGTGIELPDLDRILAKIQVTLDDKEQDRLWRQAGEVTFVQHREIPLFWIPVEAAVNPNIVAGWDYPGGITGAWTHVYNIKAVK
jgi:peptide/nickel transport system substrate-binding protein